MPARQAGFKLWCNDMTKQNDSTGWYANVFKGWQSKLLGAKPTTAQLDAIHALGARPGKQALASAMALRDAGVTGGQIVIACGAPQLNKMRGFVTDGLARFVPTPPSGEGHKVYRLELTAKGKAKGNATAKVAKPKAARKPKTKPVTVPVTDTSEPVNVTVTQ